jgi:hypothetical protein
MLTSMSKRNKIQISLIGAFSIGMLVLSSCERKYDNPPVTEIPVGNIIDIATLKGMYSGLDISIQEDYSLYATVTADESTGNFYKEAYVQDGTGAIKLRLVSAGGLYIGDSIRVYLKGTRLSNFNGLLQIDSVDVDKNVIKQAVGKYVEPTVYGLDQISAGLQSQLVRIENVEFVAGELGTTWANAITQFSVNHNVTDCNGNTRLLRTSGYSNFAGEVIPNGNGYLTAIVGVFNSDVQLYIRTPNEVVFTGERCTGGGPVTCNPLIALSESFSNHTTNGTVSDFCWFTSSTSGTPQWFIEDISGNKSAVASLSGTSNSGSQNMWMVSPEITYASSNTLSFKSAVLNYNHDGLQVYVLTNYSGDPNSATQTLISSATLAGNGTGNNVFVGSGTIPLSTFGISGSYRIAFKYTGNPGSGQTSTYKIDDVVISQ